MATFLNDLPGALTTSFSFGGDEGVFGSSSIVGDINGDGFVDLVVSANVEIVDPTDPARTSGGATFVVFGNAGGFADDIDLANLNGANGFTITRGDSY
ncbi:MAG: integrin alpha, partial [Pseudomonadota bacterium]